MTSPTQTTHITTEHLCSFIHGPQGPASNAQTAKIMPTPHCRATRDPGSAYSLKRPQHYITRLLFLSILKRQKQNKTKKQNNLLASTIDIFDFDQMSVMAFGRQKSWFSLKPEIIPIEFAIQLSSLTNFYRVLLSFRVLATAEAFSFILGLLINSYPVLQVWVNLPTKQLLLTFLNPICWPIMRKIIPNNLASSNLPSPRWWGVFLGKHAKVLTHKPSRESLAIPTHKAESTNGQEGKPK